MKKILFLMMAALVIVGCSKSDDETKDSLVDFTLSKTEVNLTVDDETRIEVLGINIDECEVYSEDEFIAYAIKYNGKYDILYETGQRPATRNYIYFAKDLETAQNHNFTN